jgi:hypothetical protein
MGSNILQSALTSQAQLSAHKQRIEELYMLVSALQQQVQVLSDRITFLQNKRHGGANT